MQNSIFNTTYENSLRILIMLSLLKEATSDKLSALDFIVIYGKSFEVSEENLHGENEFNFGEFALRRKNMSEALKMLVLNGLVTVKNGENGFNYTISSNGLNMCENMSTGYAKEYKLIAMKAVQNYGSMNELELLETVTKKSMDHLRR